MLQYMPKIKITDNEQSLSSQSINNNNNNNEYGQDSSLSKIKKRWQW